MQRRTNSALTLCVVLVTFSLAISTAKSQGYISFENDASEPVRFQLLTSTNSFLVAPESAFTGLVWAPHGTRISAPWDFYSGENLASWLQKNPGWSDMNFSMGEFISPGIFVTGGGDYQSQFRVESDATSIQCFVFGFMGRWNGGGGSGFDRAYANQDPVGVSEIFTINPSPLPSPSLLPKLVDAGFQGFTMVSYVPEPAPIVLCGVFGAMLALRSRGRNRAPHSDKGRGLSA